MRKFIVLMVMGIMVGIVTEALAVTVVGFRNYSVPSYCTYIKGTAETNSVFRVAGGGKLTMPSKTNPTATLTVEKGMDYSFSCHKASDDSALAAKMFFDVDTAPYFPVTTKLISF